MKDYNPNKPHVFVSYRHKDFERIEPSYILMAAFLLMFAGICEQLGWAGGMVVLGLFLLLIIELRKISQECIRAKSKFGTSFTIAVMCHAVKPEL